MSLWEAIVKTLRKTTQTHCIFAEHFLSNCLKANPKSIIASVSQKVNLHLSEYHVPLLKSTHRGKRITYMKYTHLELRLPKNWHNIVTFHIV